MSKNMVITLFIFFITVSGSALIQTSKSQVLTPEWEKSFDTIGLGTSALETRDGAYVVLALTAVEYSTDPNDVGNPYVNASTTLTKIGSVGNIQWSKSYGSVPNRESMFLTESEDGDYIVAQPCWTPVGIWVIKTDNEGDIQWNNTYSVEQGPRITAISGVDGGCIVVGYILVDTGGTTKKGQCWTAKISSSGNLEWQKTYENLFTATSAVESADGGYLIGGHNGNVLCASKIDKDGVLQWSREYSDFFALPWNIIKTSDEKYLISGQLSPPNPEGVPFVAKIDPRGVILWNCSYEFNWYARFNQAVEIKDGGFLINGWTSRRDSSGYVGASLLVRINSNGEELWNQTIAPFAFFMRQASDEGIMFSGSNNTNPENPETPYIWVAKMAAEYSLSTPSPSAEPSYTLIPTLEPSFEPTSTPKATQQSGFLGTNLPTEYGYLIVGVIVVVIMGGSILLYLKKLRRV
jgi:hypothetical protein